MSENIFMFIFFAVGILLIVKGGDVFVDSASYIAEAFGIPKFIIGATIVSLATTLPETIVSSIAAIQSRALVDEAANSKVAMAIGNAVGSVTANFGLILAISIIFMPLAIERKKYNVKAILLLLSVGSLTLLCLSGDLTLLKSLVLLAIFIVFIIENIKSAKTEVQTAAVETKSNKLLVKNIILLIIGAAAIVIGSNLLVNKGSEIAYMFGVSEKIIGFTAIAIGTSLPELVTTISSLIKREPSMGVGNIIGANIIDVTMILPICAIIKGGSLPVETQVASFDIPVCLLITIIAIIPPMIQKKFMRWQGFTILAIYFSYLVYSCAVA